MFPAPSDSRIEWTAFDEAADAWPDEEQPPLWSMVVEGDADQIAVTLRWTGAVSAPADNIAIVLPLDEGRRVTASTTSRLKMGEGGYSTCDPTHVCDRW